MIWVAQHAARAAVLAFGMAWQVGWSLVLGFVISAVLQAVVSKDRIGAALGGNGVRATAIAMAAGAASSSCSYASAAVARTLFRKGAGLVPSLAFLLSSTNLVVELGIVLYLLLGWPFMLGEWAGGVVLVAVMAVIVRLTYPARLAEAARHHGGQGDANEHGAGPDGSWRERLARRETWLRVAQGFAMDWSMLWKDVVLGFLIAGALAAFVPASWWQVLFVQGAAPWVQVPANALLGPLVAVLSFVCSIGNVPMAAVLWGSGVSFGGVLAFLFADLIVLPLLDVYRRSFGIRMAAYIGIVFYAAMVLAAMAMDAAFSLAGWVPAHRTAAAADMVHFRFDYTFYLNLIFGAVALVLAVVSARAPPAPARHDCCGGH